MNNLSKVVLQARDLNMTYQEGSLKTEVIHHLNFDLLQNQRVAITGVSGSGKSTLLHLLAGLETPTSGEVLLMGQDFNQLSDAQKGQLRNQYMGFVYQFHYLLPELTALENTMLPLRVARRPAQEAEQKAKVLLERVGLGHRLRHKPSELSGGERQRVAIARALITEPACVLADEPTGNLDEASAQQVFQLMKELNEELNTALLLVTHDLALAQEMDVQYHLVAGHFEMKAN